MEKNGDADYYFSNLTHVWGWASWRRVWNNYSKDLIKFNENELRARLEKVFDDNFIIDIWVQVFKDIKAGKIDTWDYQLTLTNFFNNTLSIIPNNNLVSNIGFGNNSTHTADADNPYVNLSLNDIGAIVHPVNVLLEKQADLRTLYYEFDIENRRTQHNLLRRRFKRWIKARLGSKK